jgi:hypothetical protein
MFYVGSHARERIVTAEVMKLERRQATGRPRRATTGPLRGGAAAAPSGRDANRCAPAAEGLMMPVQGAMTTKRSP